jgi:hypothetical protein
MSTDSESRVSPELEMEGLSAGVPISEYKKFLRGLHDAGRLTDPVQIQRICIGKTESKSNHEYFALNIASPAYVLVFERHRGASIPTFSHKEPDSPSASRPNTSGSSHLSDPAQFPDNTNTSERDTDVHMESTKKLFSALFGFVLGLCILGLLPVILLLDFSKDMLILVVERLLRTFRLERRLALDTVTLLEGQLPDNEIIASAIVPPQKAFSLYQATSLGHAIGNSDSIYRLLSRNCYWFAGLMLGALANFSEIEIRYADGRRRAGRWRGVWTTYLATTKEIEDLSALIPSFTPGATVTESGVGRKAQSPGKVVTASASAGPGDSGGLNLQVGV